MSYLSNAIKAVAERIMGYVEELGYDNFRYVYSPSGGVSVIANNQAFAFHYNGSYDNKRNYGDRCIMFGARSGKSMQDFYRVNVPSSVEEFKALYELAEYSASAEFKQLLEDENFNALDEKFESIAHLFC